MNERQTELEKQVANLTSEIGRLKRSIRVGLLSLAILFAVIFIAPGMLTIVITIAIVLWAVVYLGATFGSVLSRRVQRLKKLNHLIHGKNLR